MAKLLDRTTLLLMIAALALTIPRIFPPTRDMLLFYIIRRAMFVGDAMFHEMGHTIFFWLFGQPAIPMIFTIFGSDQAGGMSMPIIERSWIMQDLSFAALAYGCYWTKKNAPGLFIPAI